MTSDDWISHFKSMALGQSKPGKHGLWTVKRTIHYQEPSKAKIQVVSQAEQAVKQARAKRKRVEKEKPKKRAKVVTTMSAKQPIKTTTHDVRRQTVSSKAKVQTSTRKRNLPPRFRNLTRQL